MRKVRRLGIFVFYDASGIVDLYIQELLKSLLSELNKLVIVVNGKITNNCRQVLEKYSNNIFIRENKGFDAGAYKEFFFKFYCQVKTWNNGMKSCYLMILFMDR